MKKIFSVADLSAILSAAKCGGQYVSVSGKSEIKLNKFPTDGSKKIRLDENFKPYEEFSVSFHFGQDYDKTMSRLLGCDYKASDANRVHLVKNVLMQYVSTGTTCIIYMPENYTASATMINGKELTDEEKAYMARYKSKAKPSASPLEYRTLGVKNLTRIAIDHEVYEVCIGKEVQASG